MFSISEPEPDIPTAVIEKSIRKLTGRLFSLHCPMQESIPAVTTTGWKECEYSECDAKSNITFPINVVSIVRNAALLLKDLIGAIDL
mmetsp:Transcript_252/g.565  ORF Transcript_252/g.565 Transcript_252/m.565 type:complete len:87 (+) Transcript_252:1756-2016(+)